MQIPEEWIIENWVNLFDVLDLAGGSVKKFWVKPGKGFWAEILGDVG